MEPGIRPGQGPGDAEVTDAGGQGGLAVPVLHPHPGDVTLEMSSLQEAGEGVLLKGGDRRRVEEKIATVALRQMGGQHHIADA